MGAKNKYSLLVYWFIGFIDIDTADQNHLRDKRPLLLLMQMRYLLLIPAVFLFLSNIPFIHKMEMKEMMATVKKDGCCKKSDSPKSSCRMETEEQPACHKPVQQEDQSCQKEERACGKQAASTCVCICCFQFAAPDPVAAKLRFECNGPELVLNSYLLLQWKDPQLAIPWQPPDV